MSKIRSILSGTVGCFCLVGILSPAASGEALTGTTPSQTPIDSPQHTRDWSGHCWSSDECRPRGASDWETHQGNPAHDGFVDVALDPAKFVEVWSWASPMLPYGQEYHPINSVATGQGVVFVTLDVYAEQAELYALDEATGSIRWKFDGAQALSAGPPAYGDGRVFFSTSDFYEQCVYWSVNATSGTLVYQIPTTSLCGGFLAPTVDRGSLFQTTRSGIFYSFRDDDGVLRWSASTSIFDKSTPAVSRNHVYMINHSSSLPEINVYERGSGQLVESIRGSFPTPPLLTFPIENQAPVLGGRSNVIAMNGGDFGGLSFNSAEPFYSRQILDFDLVSATSPWQSQYSYFVPPAVAGGIVYAARNAPASLDALSEVDGHILWSWTPPPGDTSFHRNIVVTRNLLFVSTDANVYAIDLATHQSVWHFPHAGTVAISRDLTIYIETGVLLSDGTLVAIKAAALEDEDR